MHDLFFDRSKLVEWWDRQHVEQAMLTASRVSRSAQTLLSFSNKSALLSDEDNSSPCKPFSMVCCVLLWY